MKQKKKKKKLKKLSNCRLKEGDCLQESVKHISFICIHSAIKWLKSSQAGIHYVCGVYAWHNINEIN